MAPDAHGIQTDQSGLTLEELVTSHLDLADRLSRRFSSKVSIDEDLRQVARVGLMLAARRYHPERGSFVRFATVTIRGELKKHFRDHGWDAHVPRSRQEDALNVSNAVDILTTRLGRSPTVSEVAEHTALERERVVEALRTREARFAQSLEALDVDLAGSDGVADTALVSIAIDRLPDDERQLIEYRFRDGLTQAEIGRLIGISQPQVHRRVAAAVDRLRMELREGDV